MKKIIFTLLMIAISVSLLSNESEAQRRKRKKDRKGNDKKEEKIWKKKLKSMDVLEFKKMVEDFALMKREQGSLDRQAEVLKKQAEGQLETLKVKEEELQQVETKLQEMKKNGGKKQKQVSASPKKDDFKKGLVFKVQMGAYKDLDLDLTQFHDKGAFFVSTDDKGFTKYTIGQFRDYLEAHRFRIYISEMGVKGAFVVAYQDNVRVEDMKTVVDKPYEERMDEILGGGSSATEAAEEPSPEEAQEGEGK